MAIDFRGDERQMSVGIDVVSIRRIESKFAKVPELLRDYVYTEAEQSYSDTKYYPPEHYAARWAAKEAFIKALDVEGANPDLTSIEVLGDPSPYLSLSGEALELLEKTATRRGTVPKRTSIVITLTHDRKSDIAIGMVVILYGFK